uniref:transcriptional regulator n=1 Tax=Pseudomonas sp. EA_65y_Pfl1_P120 TaxID=3088693 RepID=UPI0030DB3C0C
MEQTAIQKAVALAGGQSALARSLSVTPQAVQKMCASGRVPAERVLDIEKLTGVSRSELRPDLYPVAA